MHDGNSVMQLLGLVGLGSAGGFERLHFLLEGAFDGPHLTKNFLIVSSLSASCLYIVLGMKKGDHFCVIAVGSFGRACCSTSSKNQTAEDNGCQDGSMVTEAGGVH